MSIDFLLIFFIARYLRKSLKLKELSPGWDKKLLIATYASMTLFVAAVFLDDYAGFIFWLEKAALIATVYILYKQPIFKPVRSLVLAIVPYIVVDIFVHLIKIIAPGFYKEWGDVFDNINLFTILWGVGVWLVTGKQRKELDKAKARVIDQEQNNKIITAVKAQLEVEVAERTAELTKQKEELEEALNELKSTQAQLIQSEKMASLGELTAGIAHEIQNPLNFVNNFSEVNAELIEEIKEEIEKGNIEEAFLILKDLENNEQKINHHGKRADGIVKGMLQHSRKSSGQKELTDINTLADEYLRLAYHGLRAKDKSFNAKFETDYDVAIEKINIMPQEIGRVILNLINNAFYAVTEKKNLLNKDEKN